MLRIVAEKVKAVVGVLLKKDQKDCLFLTSVFPLSPMHSPQCSPLFEVLLWSHWNYKQFFRLGYIVDTICVMFSVRIA